jgi:uncharacterized protein YndB with AHSA1/START domain
MSEPLLEITTRISATPATVWRYFTDPERFARWMGAAQGEATVDPRVGGPFRLEFPDFGQVVSGEVLEMVENERFVFSWGYEGELQDVPPGSSRVEIRLTAFDGGTVLDLRHSGLPGDEAVERHRAGFRLYTSVLAAAAAGDQFRDAAEHAVERWFAMWKEGDRVKRRELLEACCGEQIEFRDEFAAVRGLDDLDGHVGMSRIVSRGIELQPGASVTRCHELLIFDWQAVVGDGSVVATGRNVGRLGVDGRFVSVHGFRDEKTDENGTATTD